jgi:xanthine dehydrogenase accessory factor
VLVEARMKGVRDPALAPDEAPIVIALGPGYEAGRHCHRVVETNRGPALGQVIDRGQAELHTGVPGAVLGFTEERLLRSPVAGTLQRAREIGDFVQAGEVIAHVDEQPVRARIDGMVRGLMLDGMRVPRGKKVGDIDPRRDRGLLEWPSDKAERVGAGVIAAIRSVLAEPSGRNR